MPTRTRTRAHAQTHSHGDQDETLSPQEREGHSTLKRHICCHTLSNNYDLCSGYFPDFIPIDENKCVCENPHFYNGGFLKQVSNPRSKYNDNYFSEMIDAYSISKYIWGGAFPDSRVGTGKGIQGEWHTVSKNKPSSKLNKVFRNKQNDKPVYIYKSKTSSKCNNNLGSQRHNQQKSSRFKYYNPNNSSKMVDSYNINSNNSNKNNNSIKHQGHPSSIYRHPHTPTHTQKHRHTPTHTHTRKHRHTPTHTWTTGPVPWGRPTLP